MFKWLNNACSSMTWIGVVGVDVLTPLDGVGRRRRRRRRRCQLKKPFSTFFSLETDFFVPFFSRQDHHRSKTSKKDEKNWSGRRKKSRKRWNKLEEAWRRSEEREGGREEEKVSERGREGAWEEEERGEKFSTKKKQNHSSRKRFFLQRNKDECFGFLVSTELSSRKDVLTKKNLANIVIS